MDPAGDADRLNEKARGVHFARRQETPQEVLTSYAQNSEDILLNRVFGHLTQGFYVDIGAVDPVIGSVTKSFYDRGWSGINIEPSSAFRRLAAARPRDVNLNIAVLDGAGTLDYFVEDANVRDTANSDATIGAAHRQDGTRAREVAGETLEQVLAKHAAGRSIDFIRIGARQSVNRIIGSTDWRKIRPQVLLVEGLAEGTGEPNSHPWESGLLASGYKRAYFDGLNLFFVPEENADSLRHFDRPVNVLDGFEKYDPVKIDALEELNDLRNLNAQIVAGHHAAVTAERQLRERLENALQRVASVLAQRDPGATFGPSLRMEAISPAIEQLLQKLEAAVAASVHYDRITKDLRDPDAPRSIRAVLPLARFIRRGRRLGGRLSPQPAPRSPPKSAESRHRVLRKIGRVLYRPIRPIVRPMALRTREFFLEPLRPVIAQTDTVARQVDAIARDVGAVRLALASAQLDGGLSADLVKSIETLLITVALNDSRSR
jgi:hypothetical protein